MDFLPSQRRTNHLPPTPNDPRFRRGNNTPCDMLQLAGYCPDVDCPASHQVCFYQFSECSVKCSSIHLDYQLWPSFYNYYNISNELRQQYAHYTNLIGQEQLSMFNRMYNDNTSGNDNNNNNNYYYNRFSNDNNNKNNYNRFSSYCSDNNNNIFSGYGNNNINNMRKPVPCLYIGDDAFYLQNDYCHQSGLNTDGNSTYNFNFRDNADNETFSHITNSLPDTLLFIFNRTIPIFCVPWDDSNSHYQSILKPYLSTLLYGVNYNPQHDMIDYSQYIYDPYDPGLVLKQLIRLSSILPSSSFNTNSSYMRYNKIYIGFGSMVTIKCQNYTEKQRQRLSSYLAVISSLVRLMEHHNIDLSEQQESIHNILNFFADNSARTARVAQHHIYTDTSDPFFTQQILSRFNNLSLDNNTPTTTTTPTTTLRSTRMGTREVSTALPSVPCSTNEPDRCAICLADFVNSNDPKHFLKCGHFFHPDCIKDLLSSGSKTCPLCRAGV